MTTIPSDTIDERAETPPRASRPRLARVSVFGLLVVAVLVPLMVTLISLIGIHWHPATDQALEILRIRDVGGRHTPLTGVQSRFGWDHPGPLMFWLLAPFRWAAGDTGVLVGVACINGAAIVAALFLARRRGGLPFAVLLGVVILVLTRALGLDLLIDPWNPWVAVLPFLVYMLLAWSLADRDLVALPALAGVGSFLVQTHVGYLPLVVGVGATAGVLALLRGRDEPKLARGAVRKPAAIAGGVGLALWLAPLIQQVTGTPGNLGEILRYFRDPYERTLGGSYGFGLMGRELRLPGAWITGNDSSPLGFTFTGGTTTALVLLVVALGLGFLAWRRRHNSEARFTWLMVATAWFGVLSGARITGVPGSYLLRWWWVIAALLWCSILWAVWSLSPIVRERLEPALVPVGCAVIVVLAAIVAWDAVPARVPYAQFSTTISRLAPGTVAQSSHDHRYLVRWVNSDALGAVGVGMHLALSERGYDVRVPPEFGRGFGKWRAAQPGETDGTIYVLSSDSIEGYALPPDAVLAAQYDPLTDTERQQAQAIERDIRSRTGSGGRLRPDAVESLFGRASLQAAGVDPASIEIYRKLRRRGLAYSVFVVPPR